MLDQPQVTDRTLNFLDNGPWNEVINPSRSRYSSAPDYRYLDVETAWSLDMRYGDRAHEIRKKLQERNDNVVVLGRSADKISAEDAAIEMWRALVIFTRAAMAGYGSLVKPHAMFVKSDDPALSVQVRPLISLEALGRLVGRTPAIALLLPFQEAKVLDIFSRDEKDYYVGVRVRAITPTSALWNRYWPVLGDRSSDKTRTSA